MEKRMIFTQFFDSGVLTVQVSNSKLFNVY